MAKFLDHLLIGLAWVLVIAAGAYFGGPRIWAHIQEGETAKVTARAQTGALAADAAAATRAQTSCTSEVTHAMDAAKAIAAASRPAPAAAGQSRPMVAADQIRAAIQ